MTKSSVEEVLKAGHFQQRIFVRNAIYAAERVLPKHLAKLVTLELEGSVNFSDRFGASPLAIRAAGDLLGMDKERNEAKL